MYLTRRRKKLTLLQLSQSEHNEIIRLFKYRYAARFSIKHEDIEDFVQEAYLSFIEKFEIIHFNDKYHKINILLKYMYYCILAKIKYNRVRQKYRKAIFLQLKHQEESQATQFEYVLQKELSTYQIDLSCFNKKPKIDKPKITSQMKTVVREDGLEFKSAGEAAKYMKVGRSSISNAILAGHRCVGYKWSYK